MKRWCKRLAGLAAGLVVLLLLGLWVEHVRGEWALSARLKELARRGERLSVAGLKPKPPAPEQNMFIDLLALTNQVRTITSNLDLVSPSMRVSSPGRAVVLSKLDHWSHDGMTNDWQQLGEELKQARSTIDALESAAEKPAFDDGFDYDKGFVDFHLQPIWELRSCCKLLSWSVLYELKQGNLERAHKDLTALVNLVAKESPEPLVICQLVRQACAAWAFNTTWQALQAEGWTDAQLASLQAAWQRCDFVNDMTAAMQMERAMTLDYYDQLRHSRRKLARAIEQRQQVQELTDGLLGGLPTHGFVLHWLHVPMWRIAWAAQDELAALEQWQVMIQRERLARTNGWAALAAATNTPNLDLILPFGNQKELGWYDRLRYLFSSENFSINDAMIRRTLEAQTQQQMVLAVLGIHRYRLRTGKLPAHLSDLVPGYVAALPHDFMRGKELFYFLRRGGDDFVLYSVREDGKDNGGNPAQREEKTNYHQIWDGRDAVWPSVATAEEARSAVGTNKHD